MRRLVLLKKPAAHYRIAQKVAPGVHFLTTPLWRQGQTPPAPQKPIVTEDPQTQNGYHGGTLTFSAVFSGATSLQWYRDGAPVAGATGSSYTTDPLDHNAEESFSGFCRGTNAEGSTDTDTATGYVLFTPQALIDAGNARAWVDGSRMDTFTQDTAGLVPCTALGQTVEGIKASDGTLFVRESGTGTNTLQQLPSGDYCVKVTRTGSLGRGYTSDFVLDRNAGFTAGLAWVDEVQVNNAALDGAQGDVWGLNYRAAEPPGDKFESYFGAWTPPRALVGMSRVTDQWMVLYRDRSNVTGNLRLYIDDQNIPHGSATGYPETIPAGVTATLMCRQAGNDRMAGQVSHWVLGDAPLSDADRLKLMGYLAGRAA